ncbi:hypothetical protein BGX38DRAFT_1196559 [Terfezia claveryi]|nr:hypothetical protein BGX38DRAFT_1196559 [Terfezia claveryi]
MSYWGVQYHHLPLFPSVPFFSCLFITQLTNSIFIPLLTFPPHFRFHPRLLFASCSIHIPLAKLSFAFLIPSVFQYSSCWHMLSFCLWFFVLDLV